MAEISKLKASQVRPIIVHAMRGIPGGKANGNEAIDAAKISLNYSLINRGNSVNEINQYRHAIEKEIFHYKRKDIVHAVEYIFQLPRDCPPEQEQAFFQACHDFVCEEMLPMGEKCVFVSQVHQDEFYKDGNGNILLDYEGNVLSKKHLDMMAIPAVPDNKHEGYSWRLCADQLTRRQALKTFHNKLQKYIDNYENETLGITRENPLIATVLHKKSGAGKTIGLSTKQLKEITSKTGVIIDKSITIDDLGEILLENKNIKIFDQELKEKLRITEQLLDIKTNEIEHLKTRQMDIATGQTETNRILKNENNILKNRLYVAETEKEQLISALRARDSQIIELKSSISNSYTTNERITELEQENKTLKEMLSNQKEVDYKPEKKRPGIWKNSHDWNSRDYEEEKTW